MKLDELLEKITPLPWPMPEAPAEWFNCPSRCETLYERHAANVLPQLVEAVRRQCGDIYHPDLLEALKLAEDVKSPND